MNTATIVITYNDKNYLYDVRRFLNAVALYDPKGFSYETIIPIKSDLQNEQISNHREDC